MGTLGFEDSDVKSLLLLIQSCFQSWSRLRHAPLIMSTPREKLQDKLVLDGRRSPILKKDEANTIQICLYETFISGTRQIRSGGKSETFGPEDERAS